MKHLLMVSVLTLSSAFAMAAFDDQDVVFLSWCDQQNVMQHDSAGQSVIRSNCADEQKVCQNYRSATNRRVIFSAMCVAPN